MVPPETRFRLRGLTSIQLAQACAPGSDELDELVGGCPDQGLVGDHVTHHRQAHHLSCGHPRPDLRLRATHSHRHLAEDLSCEELTQHPRRVVVTHCRPDQRDQSFPPDRRVPDPEEGAR